MAATFQPDSVSAPFVPPQQLQMNFQPPPFNPMQQQRQPYQGNKQGGYNS